MSKVLIVLGTGGSFDYVDLPLALKKRGIQCVECHWSNVGEKSGTYDLAILFGLDERENNKADLFATAVRKAIGPDTKFLIVSKWGHSLVNAQRMKEKYTAEYFVRNDPFNHLVDTVLKMLGPQKCDA